MVWNRHNKFFSIENIMNIYENELIDKDDDEYEEITEE